MLKYLKNYDGYQTVEDVANQLEDFHVIFLKLYGCALALHIFDNLPNNHKISTDALNSKEINLKDRRNNTPILRDGYYIDQNGNIFFIQYIEARHG